MKVIPLSKRITGHDDKPLVDKDGVEMCIGNVFVAALGRSTFQDGRDVILAHKVGRKIYDQVETGAESMELEDAEFALLKQAAQLNGPQFISLILGPTLEELYKVV